MDRAGSAISLPAAPNTYRVLPHQTLIVSYGQQVGPPRQAQLHAMGRSGACRCGLCGLSSAAYTPAEHKSWRKPAMASVWVPSEGRLLSGFKIVCRGPMLGVLCFAGCSWCISTGIQIIYAGEGLSLCDNLVTLSLSLSGKLGHTEAPSGTEPNPR